MTDVAVPAPVHELIAAVHATDTACVLAVTGGGTAALAWLLGVPGASRTVLEATVPYAATALADLLGGEPHQAVSADTAVAMARACRARAGALAPDASGPLLGVAATAALVTDRPRRGDHRAHVAVAGPDGARVWELRLERGRRDRAGEETVVARLIVGVLASACGVADPGPSDLLGPGDELIGPVDTPTSD